MYPLNPVPNDFDDQKKRLKPQHTFKLPLVYLCIEELINVKVNCFIIYSSERA